MAPVRAPVPPARSRSVRLFRSGATFTTTTSGGGGSTSTGTPDWSRYENYVPWDYQRETASRSACAANEGVTYEVGPGKTYSRAAQVPWLKLMPCDQVLFYYSSTPYTDIVFVGSRGEKNKWITIAGVAGPNGELPVFDGNGAIMPKGTGANSYSDSAGMIEVVVPDSSVVSRASLYKPGYLHITRPEVPACSPVVQGHEPLGHDHQLGRIQLGHLSGRHRARRHRLLRIHG